MTTYAQYQAKGLAFLKAQVGKGYTEVLGQNLGPYRFDCEGLAYRTYEAAAGLTSGPGIGPIGSRAQYELSTVKCQPSDPWLILDQLFFDGSNPPFGHTGMYVGRGPGGAYMMISALDTASGVCYSEIDPTIGGPGFAITGRTRPLSLAPITKPPGGGDMTLIFAQGGAVEGIGADSYWIYGISEDIGPYLWHVKSMDTVRINELLLPFKTISTYQVSLLNAKLLNV
jgi:hypothetical protein